MRRVAILTMTVLVQHGLAQTSRYWFAYGDEASAQRARASGIDPQAQVGREIVGNRLAVPTNGKPFKVQLFTRVEISGLAEKFTSVPTVNLAFDRTFGDDGNQNPPLNSSSFRKVRPAGANQNNYVEAFSNGAIVPAWENANTRSDEDNNGVQDTARIEYLQTSPSAWRQGTQGAGVSLRPVGLATYLTGRLVTPPEFAGSSIGFTIPTATSFRIIDVNWMSMLNVGETYGDRPGETGLSITTSNVLGLANTTGIINTGTHTGSRYTLVAVAPEPGAGVAFGIGALLLMRRRKSP